MKQKTKLELISMYDSLRHLERAAADLFAASEKLLAGRVRSLKNDIEVRMNQYEVVVSPAYLGKNHDV